MKNFKSFIYEANLAGRTVNYAQPTGAFYKYVEMSIDPSQDYESDKNAKLLDMSGVATGEILKKGQKFKILDREEKDLNDQPTYRSRNWMPFEISVVGTPADPTIGIGRSKGSEVELEVEDSFRNADGTKPEIKKEFNKETLQLKKNKLLLLKTSKG